MTTEFQDFNDEPDHHVDEQKIRREYRNLDTVKVPYVATKGFSFIIAKFLDVDERGGDIGTSPVVYRSCLKDDGENTIVLASHALQTEQGVAYVLRKLRIEFCDGNLDEAVRIVDEAKAALGIDCEAYIGLLREEHDTVKVLSAKHEERLKLAASESKRLTAGPAAESVAEPVAQPVAEAPPAERKSEGCTKKKAKK